MQPSNPARALCAAIAIAMSVSGPALAANLYTSNFGVGPNDGKEGWFVSSPYAQSPTEIGKLNNSGATFRVASPVASAFATLTFTIYGSQDVIGANAAEPADEFSLAINGEYVFSATFGLTAGQDNVTTDTTASPYNPGGVTFTPSGLRGREVVVPFALRFQGFDPGSPIYNTFDFSYAGLTTMNGDAFSIGSLTIDYERGVAPSPTPEPAAWALMILGFGACGVGLRRSRTVEVSRRA